MQTVLRAVAVSVLGLGLVLASACGSDGGSSSGVAPGDGDGGASSGGDPAADGGGAPVAVGGPCATNPGWADAPELTNVRAAVRNDSLEITFDGVDDAKDYRVYALPSAGDVSTAAGVVTIKNGTYRCAGERTVAPSTLEDAPQVQSGAIRTRVASSVEGVARKVDGATLGHVFVTPGPGRVPVFALGHSESNSDNSCYFQRWTASRVKTYTTAEAERAALLAKSYRDDGVAFYVPADGAPGTAAVYRSDNLYFGEDEKASRSAPEVAFSVLSAPAEGTRPLMRVYYENGCGASHDELAVGKPAFERAYRQGNHPLTHLHWSGLTSETTLVVEALDALCPHQGHLTTTARAAGSEDGVDYPAFFTVDQVRQATPSGEVFVNGQGAASNAPKATARSCLTVEKSPGPAMDFAADFSQPEVFSTPTNGGFKTWFASSPNFDVGFYSVAGDWYSIGQNMGELWVTLADWAADTNGKMRLTPKQKATLAADAFVHVTFDVDSFSTGRRYPQVLISDRSWPVQENLAAGSTIVVETIHESPVELQVQLCDHRTWEVNNQCPYWDLYGLGSGSKSFLAPVPELVDEAGGDRMNRYDVYASTSRVYVYFDGAPYGCVELTPNVMPAGPATVTFGQVLYHSGVDLSPWNTFFEQKQKVMTGRHWDNLGFTSNAPAPSWDEARLPCVPASARKEG